MINLESDKTASSWCGSCEPGRSQKILLDSQGSVSLLQEKYDKSLTGDKDHSMMTREQRSAQRERSLLFHPASLLPEQHPLSITLLHPQDNCIPHTIKAGFCPALYLNRLHSAFRDSWDQEARRVPQEGQEQIGDFPGSCYLFSMVRILLQTNCIFYRWNFSSSNNIKQAKQLQTSVPAWGRPVWVS